MINRTGYIILAVLFALSIEDPHNEDAHDDDFRKEFGDEEIHDDDSTRFSEGTSDDHIEVREQSAFVRPKSLGAADLPPLRFLYCVSCGYKQAFDQFSSFVKEKYPDMQIEGANYPPAGYKAYLAQALNIVKMAMFAVILTGSNPFATFGFGYPAFLQYLHGNKFSMCMFVFMLGNLVEGSLMSTGAFEIYLGNEQIWSKLDSGRVPSAPELIQLIDAQLGLIGKGKGEESFGDFSART
ncbi:unnamed protein product [Caenorhabditis auriculariae]|uniref:SelT-like protein n=1 Tax=Caenorhabditis auriculariae TaxID=2777116 RepID=A0A8S1H261_9PELO|nr:unnamed protein product [Caenorhabditis auriculariae]